MKFERGTSNQPGGLLPALDGELEVGILRLL